MKRSYVFAFCALVLVVGCRGRAPSPQAEGGERPAEVSGSNSWLLSSSSDDARFALIAKHLRGFDMAMAETGYRYGELYWAGEDRNWGYAKYQLGKIRTAIGNGLERRPKRTASAKMIEGPLAAVEEAIEAESPALFVERFQVLTATCNACHQAEAVSFVHVQPPAVRNSPINTGSSKSDGP